MRQMVMAGSRGIARIFVFPPGQGLFMMKLMEHRDAEVSDIVVVLKSECAEQKLDEIVAALKKLGMEIENTDADNGVVEGALDAQKVADVKKWVCVEYVRVEFTYIADYPPDDPRNLDPVGEEGEDSEE